MIRQIEPGKARWAFKPEMWNSRSTVAENKFDGSRYLLQVGPEINQFTSRHISKKTGNFVEKTNNLPHLRDLTMRSDGLSLEGCVFDGEIVYSDNLHSKSSDVTHIMGSLPDKAIALQGDLGKLDYYAFDILYDRGKDVRDLPYKTRREILVDYLVGLDSPSRHLKITPVVTEDKEEFYRSIIEAGGEGVILKDINAKYGDHWAKVKRKATYDVVIMGYEDPIQITKKTSGEMSISKFAENNWIGAIRFGQYFGGKLIEFGTCSGIDEALREELSTNGNKYIGKVIEIEAQERISKTGRFRHPRFLRFRPDKNAESCVYRAGEV